MSESLYKTIGAFTPDKLIAGSAIPLTAKGIKILSGEGVLERGSLLGMAADGTYKLTGKDSTIGANCILTDDIDATSEDVITTAYVSGNFNSAAIIVAEGADISTYENDLRMLGIYLKSVQDY